MKYTLCIDYKAGTKKGLDYSSLEAANVLDAMSEADRRWTEDVYMMQIMQKAGKTERKNGWRIEEYSAILARRSYSWHLNDKEHHEAPHSVRHYIPRNPAWHWYETL